MWIAAPQFTVKIIIIIELYKQISNRKINIFICVHYGPEYGVNFLKEMYGNLKKKLNLLNSYGVT